MATEQVLHIPVDRHVINTERAFDAVLEDVFGTVLDTARELPVYEPVNIDAAGSGRLVRIAVGGPDLIDELTRAVPNAAINVPSAILIQQTAGGGTRLAYDTIGRSISGCESERALRIAQRFDDEVLEALRRAAERRG